MRDPKRIKKVLKAIEKYWELYPDLRFTQVLESIFNKDIAEYYYTEDEVILRMIEFNTNQILQNNWKRETK